MSVYSEVIPTVLKESNSHVSVSGRRVSESFHFLRNILIIIPCG